MGEQTLRGLASWLASMDKPDSEARRTVTLDQIVTEAKDALENEGRSLFTQHERELRQQVEGLLSEIDRHVEAGDCLDHLLIERADQVRKELGDG